MLSVLSLPDRGSAAEPAVRKLWDDLQIVDNASGLTFLKKKPKITEGLSLFSDDELLAVIREVKSGKAEENPVKQVELEALLAAPEGFGDDVPIDPNFHARRLPDRAWRHGRRSDGVEALIQVHRLREVLALVGFTRFEAVTPDINGEYDTDVERAQIALDPAWFPAVENRGEGVFLQLRAHAILSWLMRPAVKERLDSLARGHLRWGKDRKSQRLFPGGPYILLHTLSHLLIQSQPIISMFGSFLPSLGCLAAIKSTHVEGADSVMKSSGGANAVAGCWPTPGVISHMPVLGPRLEVYVG